MQLTFPESPVKSTTAMKVRLRVLRSKKLNIRKLKRVKLKKVYKYAPFTFIIGSIGKNDFSLKIKGPIAQFKGLSIKTKRGNTFLLKERSSSGFGDSKTIYFNQLASFETATLFVEFYNPAEYCWLDVVVLPMDLTPRIKHVSKPAKLKTDFTRLIPGITDKKIPGVPENIFKNKKVLKNYCLKLKSNQIIPALVQFASYIGSPRDNSAWSWFQVDFAENIYSRRKFYEKNKENIAKVVFALYLGLPNQKNNTGLAYFLGNLQLADIVRKQALEAVKTGKLQHAISAFFRGDLSTEERKVLKTVFLQCDDWITANPILNLLTKGPKGDMVLAKQVLNDVAQHNILRSSALRIIAGHEKEFLASFLKPYLIDPETRNTALQITGSNLRAMLEKIKRNKLTKEEFKKLTAPILSVIEDLAEQKNDWERKNAERILSMLKSNKRVNVK